jgi:ABC-type multidrug transport system ATPase subunit
VSDFLGRLYEFALAPIRLTQQVNLGFRKTQRLEHIYLYLKNAEDLRKLASSYPSQQEFFRALESTYISELLSEVRIKVKVRKSDDALTFRELSEGEQQLLMVLGLLRFTKEDESLFLLDEPDTHLNPAWSMQYLRFLYEIVGDEHTSHIIMTTHDPLTIAGLMRNQVQIIQRDEETGRVVATYPEEDPRGMGIAALLTSDLYGLRSQLDLPTLGLLDEKRSLAVKDSLTQDERDRLTELNVELDRLGFTLEARDPLYRLFVKNLTDAERQGGLDDTVLTEKQRKKRELLAKKLVNELKATTDKE